MAKRKTILLLLVLTLGLTACSHSEQNANQPPATTPAAQDAKPQPDANNPNVVKGEGSVAVIPPAPQPATSPATVVPGKAPKIVLPVKKLDFGKVDQEKHLVKDIVIKNAGKAPLNIQSVTPG